MSRVLPCVMRPDLFGVRDDFGVDPPYELGLHLYLVEEGNDRPSTRSSDLGLVLFRVNAAYQKTYEIRCSPQDLARWREAQETCLAALREAETELLYAQGLGRVRPESGGPYQIRRLRWRALTLMLLPGRARRSRRAFQRCQVRLEAAAAEYEPVRQEIADRIAEVEAERRAHWNRVHALASRRMWAYQVDRRRKQVRVFLGEEGSALAVRELADELLEVRRKTGLSTLAWDAAVLAEVKRACGIDLPEWWHAVVPHPWSGVRTIPDTRRTGDGRIVHVSSHHTSYGVGGFPGTTF